MPPVLQRERVPSVSDSERLNSNWYTPIRGEKVGAQTYHMPVNNTDSLFRGLGCPMDAFSLVKK